MRKLTLEFHSFWRVKEIVAHASAAPRLALGHSLVNRIYQLGAALGQL